MMSSFNPTLHQKVVDAVLDVGRSVRVAMKTRLVGLVLGEEQRRDAFSGQFVIRQQSLKKWILVMRPQQGMTARRQRLDAWPHATARPGPGVVEPERRQQMQGRGLRSAVAGANADQHILGAGLGVLDEDIEISVLGERPGVEQFVLRFVPAARRVGRHQVRIMSVPDRVGTLSRAP
jgi:hypothetical protein